MNCEKRRLIFREASSFDNSFHVFSKEASSFTNYFDLFSGKLASFKRSGLFSKFLSVFFQEPDSFDNSFGLFSRKRTSFKRSWLFSKFLSVFFQEPDSFENSFHVFPRKPALLQIRFIQSVTERPIPGPPSVRCSRWMGRPSGVGKRNNVTRNTASGLGKATRRGNHRLRASSRACSPVLEGSRQTVDVLSCLSGVETL